MKASRTGQFCTIQYLLTNYSPSIDINRTTPLNEHSALSLACQNGHLQVVELLLQYGANPLQALKDNSNCLIEASKGGHTKIVEMLIDWNYTLNMSNSVKEEVNVEVMGTENCEDLVEEEEEEYEDEEEADDEEEVDEDCCNHNFEIIPFNFCEGEKAAGGKNGQACGRKLPIENGPAVKTEPALIKQIKKSVSRLDTTSGKI